MRELFFRSLHHLKGHHLTASDKGSAAGVGDPVTPPIVASSVYFLPGDPAGPYQYARWSNPTWSALEEALGILENADCAIFPSGMAASAAILCTQLKLGDRVLLPSDAYYTTRTLVENYLRPAGVEMATCPSAEYDRADFTGVRLVWIETPSNPGLEIVDIRRAVEKARRAGAMVVADNTTATPLGQRPLDLGADAVVSSDTKAINGHSDVVFGHVASPQAGVMAAVREWRKICGAIPGPFEAWLVHRGLETLEVRFERMCANAEALAPRLAEHAKVTEVKFPGLPGHRGHAMAKSQMLRFGTILGLTLRDKGAAEQFINGCGAIVAATSFGGIHTSAERRARWGDQVAEGFVRLSVGCEPFAPLWRAMEDSLRAL